MKRIAYSINHGNWEVVEMDERGAKEVTWMLGDLQYEFSAVPASTFTPSHFL